MTPTKFLKLLFVCIVFSLGAAPFLSYADEIAKEKCGASCHANKKNIYRKMKSSEECVQCHNTDTSTIQLAAMENKERQPVTRKKNMGDTSDMILIPAGEFIMGSNERWQDESPEFINRTKAYWIDKYEVTHSKYKAFVDATNYPPSLLWNRGEIPEGMEEHPVTFVSWFDAVAYCKWEGKRLPTEAEWEKGARGELGPTFPWGDEFDPSKSNSPQSGSKGTKPVGSFESGKSPYGLYDMVGNVWEWTANWYLPHPGNEVSNKQYGEINRLTKGGSWFDCMGYGCGISAPSFNRGAVVPETKNNTLGIRCAKDLR